MPAMVEYPQVVREAVDEFRDLFSCEPQRRHFAEYLTGLMIAANKTVTGINSEFVATTDPSCLNRFLTEVCWDEQALNERRLELLQRAPTTPYSDQGVIALENTRIDHDGKFIKDVGWFGDHAEQRNKIAHDYLFVNYVCTSGKHYLVMLAYSLLMRQLRQDCAREWALCRLKTIGAAWMLNETLRATLTWVVQQVRDYEKDATHVLARLRLT